MRNLLAALDSQGPRGEFYEGIGYDNPWIRELYQSVAGHNVLEVLDQPPKKAPAAITVVRLDRTGGEALFDPTAGYSVLKRWQRNRRSLGRTTPSQSRRPQSSSASLPDCRQGTGGTGASSQKLIRSPPTVVLVCPISKHTRSEILRMSTVLESPVSRTTRSPAQRLRATMAAVRVSLRWLGIHRTLTPEQKAQAADTFGAEGQYLSAGKKLLDTRHPAFRAVTNVRNRVLATWQSMTLPFPENGVRLIKQSDVDEFNRRMTELREELDEAVWRLDEHYAELKSAARERLGTLYNPQDYPESLRGLFSVTWDFPNVEPPDYLQGLNSALYEEECRRVAARFDEAVHLAEEAFIGELTGLVAHLTERLTGQADGKSKVFRDTAVENLLEFFGRFRQLNVRSNAQLDELVDQA